MKSTNDIDIKLKNSLPLTEAAREALKQQCLSDPLMREYLVKMIVKGGFSAVKKLEKKLGIPDSDSPEKLTESILSKMPEYPESPDQVASIHNVIETLISAVPKDIFDRYLVLSGIFSGITVGNNGAIEGSYPLDNALITDYLKKSLEIESKVESKTLDFDEAEKMLADNSIAQVKLLDRYFDKLAHPLLKRLVGFLWEDGFAPNARGWAKKGDAGCPGKLSDAVEMVVNDFKKNKKKTIYRDLPPEWQAGNSKRFLAALLKTIYEDLSLRLVLIGEEIELVPINQ